ncbi:hypothetical protein ACIRQP_33140 [Streptomyces sp. NPDC102274]|uniref:hypothetical protein n=1 Tax=Streptomyces sp. NPDC102274 TaxID=3366151 RepID=UPI0038167EB7
MRRRVIRSLRELHVIDSTAGGKSAAYDTGWAGDAWSAVGCALLLLVLLLVTDFGVGTLSGSRGAMWVVLAVLLFLVLWPPRLTAGPGWLASRGLLRERRVRTVRLTSASWSDGVAQRLVLRDGDGGQIEIDPRVLIANPALWRLLDADARTSMAAGNLSRGATALRKLSERIDRETARTVFKISDVE